MLNFKKQEDGTFDVVGWDPFNGDDDALLGSIFLHEDNYFWFEPSAERVPLTCKQLKLIFYKLSQLNKESH